MAAGRIEHVSVTWTVDTDDGPQVALISLADLQQHCRPERVQDLIEDLEVLCGDVQAARDAAESGRLRVIR